LSGNAANRKGIKMFAIYGENFGIMRLEEDGFNTEEEAIEWLRENKAGMAALANWEIKEYSNEVPLEYEAAYGS